MHRFFVAPTGLAVGAAVTLGGEAAHQVARVLRLRPGERIVLLDGGGEEWVVRLTVVTATGVTGAIEERRPGGGEPRLRLTLYQAPLKGDHMDYVLRKGTEVGIRAFVPVLTEHTIVRALGERRLDRWRRIVREAAEQAGRAIIPTVAPLVTLPDLVAARSSPRSGGPDAALAMPLLALWEGERTVGLGAALRRLPRPLAALALLIGPEGGLSEAEVAGLRAGGVVTATFGPRILRAETAGLVAASALLYAAGDLGGPPTGLEADE